MRPLPGVLIPPRCVRLLGSALLVALLAACAGPARQGGGDERDGPEAHPPPGLLQVPDAEPRVEPIRPGGANKPYTVWGQSYVPLTADVPLRERGLASWYGRKFNGKPTASGELYNMYAMTAAHPTLPIPSYARIRNPANGREVVVRINDRGPFKSQRIVDVSYTAALKLDILRGATPVELERITGDEIRAGTWRQGRIAPAVPVPADDAVSVVATVPTHAMGPTVVAAPPQPVDDGDPARAGTVAGRGFWVQLGAFRQRDGAVEFQKQVGASVEGLAPLLTVFGDAALFRLQAGPYASRDDARGAAERLRAALKLVPVIIERR